MKPLTILALSQNGFTFGALCSLCRKFTEPDMEALIEQFGAEALVSDVIERITCSHCGQRVIAQVSPMGWLSKAESP